MSGATESSPDLSIVLVTVPSEAVAAAMARTLVDERLAACVSIVPTLRSIYTWQGRVCDEAEVLCLIKTRGTLFHALAERVRRLHPYEVPEIVRVAASESSAPYLDWLLASTRDGAARS